MKLQEIVHWCSVIKHGLEDQYRLIERSSHLIDGMPPDEFIKHRDSGYKKIARAWSESSIDPLRTLKTKEKGVIVKDFKNRLATFAEPKILVSKTPD